MYILIFRKKIVGLGTFCAIFHKFICSQSYDRELQRQRCKFYNATAVNVYNASAVNFYNAMGGLTRFENKNILFYFEKRSMLPTTTLAL
jgi:hypothetical protein